MSRIGKQPVTVPAGVDVTIDGTTVTVKGGKGELKRTFSDLIELQREGAEILVVIPRAEGCEDMTDEQYKRTKAYKASNAQQGTTRTVLHNMVTGVDKGFEKKLELTGVGYRAALKG